MSLAAKNEITAADVVFLETYTAHNAVDTIPMLRRLVGKRLNIVDRQFVEDGENILEEASKKDVVLATGGDPMVATTHNELRVRAEAKGVKTRVIYGSSVASAAPAATGLHFYKFGRPITFAEPSQANAAEVYRAVHANLLQGLHSLILLSCGSDSGTAVLPKGAIRALLRSERNLKRKVLSTRTLGLILCRLGSKDERVFGDHLGDLALVDYGKPPHCLVLPGKLHFTEVESITTLLRLPTERVTDNSRKIKKTAQTLIPKYTRATSAALHLVRGKVGNRFGDLLENVELYLKDAETFLANGEDELAMLSVGYAEGLLDSLNFMNIVKIDW
jgi:diphthine synthase